MKHRLTAATALVAILSIAAHGLAEEPAAPMVYRDVEHWNQHFDHGAESQSVTGEVRLSVGDDGRAELLDAGETSHTLLWQERSETLTRSWSLRYHGTVVATDTTLTLTLTLDADTARCEVTGEQDACVPAPTLEVHCTLGPVDLTSDVRGGASTTRINAWRCEGDDGAGTRLPWTLPSSGCLERASMPRSASTLRTCSP